jgi:hypothetical protein
MLNDATMLWRSMSIERAIDEAVGPLTEQGLATGDGGASDEAIRAAAGRIGRTLPADVQAFYQRVTPVSRRPAPEYGTVAFHQLSAPDLAWLDDPQLREKELWLAPSEGCWLDGWAIARLLVIGYTPFFDLLLWCDGLTARPSGTIVLTDHEADDNPVVLGDSFAQWLGRYAAFGLTEPAIAPANLDEIEAMEPLMSGAFLYDHLRLNPNCAWAKTKMAALADKHPDVRRAM